VRKYRPARRTRVAGGYVGDILVEVRPPSASGDVARRVPVGPESFASRAGEIADAITEVAGKLRDHLEEKMAAEPNHLWQLATVELAFELALQAETGVVIARVGTAATFTATLTWSREANAGKAGQ
jgi:hypothetical protein